MAGLSDLEIFPSFAHLTSLQTTVRHFPEANYHSSIQSINLLFFPDSSLIPTRRQPPRAWLCGGKLHGFPLQGLPMSLRGQFYYCRHFRGRKQARRVGELSEVTQLVSGPDWNPNTSQPVPGSTAPAPGVFPGASGTRIHSNAAQSPLLRRFPLLRALVSPHPSGSGL